MKRSEINKVIKEMEALAHRHGFALPPFCNWTPEEWKTKGHEYDEIRDGFAETLSSTDREIYSMREKGYTQEEIARRLGYKSHSAVTKRLKAMREKLDEYLAEIEANQ